MKVGDVVEEIRGMLDRIEDPETVDELAADVKRLREIADWLTNTLLKVCSDELEDRGLDPHEFFDD